MTTRSYVYLLQIEGQPHFKIGMAGHVETRVKQLQTGLPFKLVHVASAYVADASDIERLLHSAYAAKRTNGEWFALDEEDVADLRRLFEVMDARPVEEWYAYLYCEDWIAIEEVHEEHLGQQHRANYEIERSLYDGWRPQELA